MSIEPSPFVRITQDLWAKRAEPEKRLELKQKMVEAMKVGFFYFEIPAECQPLLAPVLQFVHAYPHNPEITKEQKIKDPEYTGYNDRKEYQNEQLFVHRSYWRKYEKYLSSQVVDLAERMYQIAKALLLTIFDQIELPEDMRERASGGLVADKGMVHASFNHYRPERAVPGLPAHKDFGHMTVLYTDTDGLEAFVEGKWRDVRADKGFFIVNFGKELEILVGNKQKLVAAKHRVKQVFCQRASFGIFLDNNSQLPLYKIDGRDLKLIEERSKTFVDNCFAKAYKRRTPSALELGFVASQTLARWSNPYCDDEDDRNGTPMVSYHAIFGTEAHTAKIHTLLLKTNWSGISEHPRFVPYMCKKELDSSTLDDLWAFLKAKEISRKVRIIGNQCTLYLFLPKTDRAGSTVKTLFDIYLKLLRKDKDVKFYVYVVDTDKVEDKVHKDNFYSRVRKSAIDASPNDSYTKESLKRESEFVVDYIDCSEEAILPIEALLNSNSEYTSLTGEASRNPAFI